MVQEAPSPKQSSSTPTSPKPATIEEKISDLRAKRGEVELGGGKDRIEKQHAGGKLTARERVEGLVDKDSFQEIGLFARHRATYFGMADKEMPADGVVTGWDHFGDDCRDMAESSLQERSRLCSVLNPHIVVGPEGDFAGESI